jgi:UDP:flavonoid glycosyltransferase YjiC (YdhE family)
MKLEVDDSSLNHNVTSSQRYIVTSSLHFLYLPMLKKRILVAPLNWGLGHATRCIPIIRELIAQNFDPVIASDGEALELLKKEFPELEHYTLPSYNIRYPKNSLYFTWNLLTQTPHILRTISAEKKVTQHLVQTKNISGIISDNRWGVQSNIVPSAFITHQITVFSGFTTWLSSKIQQKFIRKFDECWIPDLSDHPNLSGKMGHPKKTGFPVKYLGVISRFEKKVLPIKYDILVLLSGPEPQRSIFENLMFNKLKVLDIEILMVRGVIEEKQVFERKNNFSVYNYLQTEELEKAMNSSKLVICRSGYTSLMDLAKLQKMAYLIPTPGQYEQEYLSGRLKKLKLLASCSQKSFGVHKLKEVENYKGLIGFSSQTDLSGIFALFKGK